MFLGVRRLFKLKKKVLYDEEHSSEDVFGNREGNNMEKQMSYW